jgi:APA family basic amino acid/polyamine antiporter
VFVIYLLLNYVFVFAPAHDAVAGKEDIATITARMLGGPTLANWVRALIVVASLTSIASMIMAGPRVYAKMADDGLFPEAFRFQGDVPRVAIAVQVVLAIGIVLISTLQGLLSYLSITLSLSAAATVASLFLQSNEHAGRIDRLLAGVFVASSLGFALLLAINDPRQLLGTAATVATGAIVYVLSRRFLRTPPRAV